MILELGALTMGLGAQTMESGAQAMDLEFSRFHSSIRIHSKSLKCPNQRIAERCYAPLSVPEAFPSLDRVEIPFGKSATEEVVVCSEPLIIGRNGWWQTPVRLFRSLNPRARMVHGGNWQTNLPIWCVSFLARSDDPSD